MLAPIAGVIALGIWIWQARYHLLLFKLVSAVWTRTAPSFGRAATRSFVILVPAHNEEKGLPATLASLLTLHYPKDKFEVLVIADNCSDGTAAVARSAGVTVLERFHETNKSKGYALEYALGKIGARSRLPDAIVVIDADTRVHPQLLQSFAARLAAGQDWIQAYYSVSNADDNLRTRMLTYAFSLFNGIWLLGQDLIGLSCALRGNGMCFSWNGLSRCPWKAYGLAEDLEFSWYLRIANERVHFAGDVAVYGEMIAEQSQSARSQRLRWEHGRKNLRDNFGPQITLARASHRWLWQADLTMPPLSRYLSFLALGGLLALPSAAVFPPLLILYLLSVLTFAAYMLSPFLRLEQRLPWRFAASLLQAPFYMLWKLRLLAGAAPQTWERAQRNAEQVSVPPKVSGE